MPLGNLSKIVDKWLESPLCEEYRQAVKAWESTGKVKCSGNHEPGEDLLELPASIDMPLCLVPIMNNCKKCEMPNIVFSTTGRRNGS